MTSSEIRSKFIAFFVSKGHTEIPSASLIPENDPSILFTTAGMHPLVPYLLGETHPAGTRLVDSQKCIRTGDIEEVGDNRHLTFFEMLGNWSLGDYFKEDSIVWSYEFLTSNAWLALDKSKIAVTVFAGDASAAQDDESVLIWKKLGVPSERIAYLGKDDNWWPAGGKYPGPQGPDTEIFYWMGKDAAPDVYDPGDARWVEIWNNVFMQFSRSPDSSELTPLAKKNVDTGMGLERITAVSQGVATVFETELFIPLFHILETLGAPKYDSDEKNTHSMRVIADHIKAATFIIGDRHGVGPSNVDQGYIVRRLIRRAIRHAHNLGITAPVCAALARGVIAMYALAYPELTENQTRIEQEFSLEEEKFARTLSQGIKEFEKVARDATDGIVSGLQAFVLFSSFGFPLELTQELAHEKELSVDHVGFEIEFKKHQEISRKGAQQKFAGGLADHSELTVAGHTATHLLHKALRTVLGDHVHQKGSNITPERLRFDFTHETKVTPEELTRVENLVNEQIKRDLPVSFELLTVEEAKARGAIGLFEDKYATIGDKVKVYSVGDFSSEICGGPHVNHTGEINSFKIIKEEAVSAGVRRIKAVVA